MILKAKELRANYLNQLDESKWQIESSEDICKYQEQLLIFDHHLYDQRDENAGDVHDCNWNGNLLGLVKLVVNDFHD